MHGVNEENVSEMENKSDFELSFPFCNSKSVDLFGFDLTGFIASATNNNLVKGQLELQQFLPVSSENSERISEEQY